VAELRKQVALAGVIGFSLCFIAPAIYLLLLVQTVFHGTLAPLSLASIQCPGAICGSSSCPWLA